MRLAIAFALTFASCLASALAQDPPTALAWRVAPDEVVLYRTTDKAAPPQLAGYSLVAPGFALTGRDLGTTGEDLPIALPLELAIGLALRLPDRAVATGKTWRIEHRVPGTMAYAGIRASGQGKVTGPGRWKDQDTLVLELALKLTADGAGPMRLASGQVKATLHYDPVSGTIARGDTSYALELVFAAAMAGGQKIPPQKHQGELAFEREAILPLAGDPLQQRINKAIDSGVAALVAQQQPDGAWAPLGEDLAGATALALYALGKSGVGVDHAAMSRGFGWLARQDPSRTYGVALTAMAIEARYSPDASKTEMMSPKERVASLEGLPAKLSVVEKAQVAEVAGWLRANGRDGRWWYPMHAGPGADPAAGYDNSNSQMAALGLLAAARCGAPVEPATWKAVARHWLLDQERGGPGWALTADKPGSKETNTRARGWGYMQLAGDATGGTMGYGSMTAGGVGSLAIARARLAAKGGLDPALANGIDLAIQDGLAWLERHYTVQTNPRYFEWHEYYLYGLERALTLTGRTRLAGRDWYREGSAVLVARQRAAGDWGLHPYQTAMALLFLRRATMGVALTEAPVGD